MDAAWESQAVGRAGTRLVGIEMGGRLRRGARGGGHGVAVTRRPGGDGTVAECACGGQKGALAVAVMAGTRTRPGAFGCTTGAEQCTGVIRASYVVGSGMMHAPSVGRARCTH
eukprot:3955124-Prymnesium_polylepis.1